MRLPAIAVLLSLTVAALAAQTGITREGGWWVCRVSGAEPVAAAAKLNVTARCAVKVSGVVPDEVAWTLTARSRSRGRLERLGVKSSRQLGDTVSLVVDSSVENGRLELRVPHALRALSVAAEGPVEAADLASARLRSSGGPIRADRIRGELEAGTAGGPIVLGEIGGAVHASTGGGSITARMLHGAAVLETGAGDIVAEQVDGRLRAATGAGLIKVARAGAVVVASTGGGQIDVAQARGRVEARNGGGPVRVGSAAGVRCETTSGAIRLTEVSGSLRASTSIGSILAQLAAGRAAGESFLTTGGGDITVTIPSNVGVKIRAENQASGDLRRIVSDYPGIAVRSAGPQVIAEGDINGGGPVLRLSGTGGTIYIRRE